MNRKYQHRGYRESEREERHRPRSAPHTNNLTREERIQKRSLRHAMDRDAREVVRCHKCGRSVGNVEAIRTDTQCPHCRAPMHCCRTCQHFDTAARHQCRAEITAPVEAKSKANSCPQWEPRLVLDVTGRRSSSIASSNDPKTQFENLFKR